MAKRRGPGGADPPFELGGYWLARERSGGVYRFWYDGRARKVRRRTLKTTDWEEAKEALAQIVITRPQADRSGAVADPRKVLLVAVFAHYLEHRAPHIVAADRAEIALAHVSRFLFEVKHLPDTLKADAFGLDLQQEFAAWSARTLQHSAASIARTLNVVSAAMHFAAEEQSIDDPDGGKRTVRLMASAPKVRHEAEWIAGIAGIAAPQRRKWVPSIEQVARFIDAIRSELAFRYVVINLNTWGRASTIMELDFRKQVDVANGLVDLNPVGRLQTIKRRPQIRLTRNLAAWAAHWNEAHPLSRAGEPVANLKKAMQATNARWMLTEACVPEAEIARLNARGNHIERTAKVHELEAAGAERITRRVIRSFMATRVRGLREIKVDREQRQIWLGHLSQDTTALYEISDPDYLRECAEATDLIIEKIGALTKRWKMWPEGTEQRELGLRLVKR